MSKAQARVTARKNPNTTSTVTSVTVQAGRFRLGSTVDDNPAGHRVQSGDTDHTASLQFAPESGKGSVILLCQALSLPESMQICLFATRVYEKFKGSE